jgi:hypothetical protein
LKIVFYIDAKDMARGGRGDHVAVSIPVVCVGGAREGERER